MSSNNTSVGSGSGTTRRNFEFGRTHVVRPRGKHQVTIVWLHGLGDKGSSWSQLLETLPLPNVRISMFFWLQHMFYMQLIKWICPTAPSRPVKIFGGFPCTAWFDVGDILDDTTDDLEGLDASAAHVANFLSTEPSNSSFACIADISLTESSCKNPPLMLAVGGFSMGAAMALYSATCHALRQYGHGNPYPINLSAVVGLSGWLPCSRTLKNQFQGSYEGACRATTLPILICHGTSDEVVPHQLGEKSAQVLSSAGFQNLTFRTYNGLGHYTIPEETVELCNWLIGRLGLEGSPT
ncbi:Phospholipase/carboxylesterase/thioesterase [Dillenia turbinata]|uniref:Phospholipase/carboxylesterase/thioesterase n=1 Tax=Dillenia turbinata TaxID=194707 RepID=A0AAN8UH39_9MAGN